MTKVRTRGNTASASVPVSKQKSIQFEDEGTNLGTKGTVDEVDFTGTGVTATRTGDKVTVNIAAGGGGGSGDVTGPASSTNNNIATFNGATGKIIKDSGLSQASFDAAGAAAAAQAASQPLDSDLTAIAALTTQAYGRSLLEAASANAARLLLGGVPFVLFKNNVSASLTGTGVETAVASYSFLIPGGTLQANDVLQVEVDVSKTGSTDTLGTRFYFHTANQISGATQWAVITQSGVQTWGGGKRSFIFKNSVASQISFASGTNIASDDAFSTGVISTYTIDFAVDQYFVVSLDLGGTGTDAGTIQSMTVEVLRNS